jgi:hypothetical protein
MDGPAGDGALYWGNLRLTWASFFLHWRPGLESSDTPTSSGLSVSSGSTVASGGLASDGVGQSSIGLVLTFDDMVTS